MRPRVNERRNQPTHDSGWARWALEHDEALDGDELEGEWLGYAALLVQVDRIVVDLTAPLPA